MTGQALRLVRRARKVSPGSYRIRARGEADVTAFGIMTSPGKIDGERHVKCLVCDGDGKSSVYPGQQCDYCKGFGRRPDDPSRTEPCKPCDGSGKSTQNLGYACVYCQGYGLVAPPGFDSPPVDGPLVVFVEAGTPRTAHLRLEEIFRKLSGEVLVCDPYYGRGSLYRLDLLDHCSPIRFLTQKPDQNETQTLPTALSEWKRQHGNVEFRRHTGRDLHDRFVLTDDELIMLGHGLKDIGGKDSFIIRIGRDVAGDTIDTVRNSFESKWQAAAFIA